jgi:NNP family nitrate/nitrite transporter-like MFS transporter
MAARSSSTPNLGEVVINPSHLKCSSLSLFSLRNQYSIDLQLPVFSVLRALGWIFRGLVSSDSVHDVACKTRCFHTACHGLAGLLVLGAIASGLAGAVHTANGLYLFHRYSRSNFRGVPGTDHCNKNMVGAGNGLAIYWSVG